MAEIRSTLDMVMEKAARMGEASTHDFTSEELVKEGMRLAAAYLRGEEVDLARSLEGRTLEESLSLKKGIVQALLRNIVLPRDEDDSADQAINGLIQLSQSAGDLVDICNEIQSILKRFLDHMKQVQKQLEEAFNQQMQAQQADGSGRMDPSLQPKFQEEWLRVKGELNAQYDQALQQLKSIIEQRLIL